jgi:hypothetical protein
MPSIEPYPYVVQIDPITIFARILSAISSVTVIWLVIVAVCCALYYFFKSRTSAPLKIAKYSAAHAVFLFVLSLGIKIATDNNTIINIVTIASYFAPFAYYLYVGKLWNKKTADKTTARQFIIAGVPFILILAYIASMLLLEFFR